MVFREDCKRCKREFVYVETPNDMSKAIVTKKTYKLTEKKDRVNKARDYCGFCGAWLR